MPKADNARKRVSAAAALEPAWRRQVSELRAREADLRLQSGRSAHRFHLAAGRLRSTLSAFRPLLAPDVIDTLTDDLRWVAVPVGDARDAESMLASVDRWSNLEPQGLDISRAPMMKLPDVSFQESWRRSIDCFDSERYDTFIRALDRFADAPPWLSSAAGRADRVLLPLLREEWTRFRKKGGKALAQRCRPAAARPTARRRRCRRAGPCGLRGARADLRTEGQADGKGCRARAGAGRRGTRGCTDPTPAHRCG